jgi:HTH-type transcriptional regulator/antitoxin MqsA
VAEGKNRSGVRVFPARRAFEEPTVDHLVCPACHEVVLDLAQSKVLRERAFETYRARYDLLSGAEIRELREHLGLTQQALARLLRLGVNTLSRWEAGRVVQAASLDVLLRMLRDLPGSIDYLKRHAA